MPRSALPGSARVISGSSSFQSRRDVRFSTSMHRYEIDVNKLCLSCGCCNRCNAHHRNFKPGFLCACNSSPIIDSSCGYICQVCGVCPTCGPCYTCGIDILTQEYRGMNLVIPSHHNTKTGDIILRLGNSHTIRDVIVQDTKNLSKPEPELRITFDGRPDIVMQAPVTAFRKFGGNLNNITFSFHGNFDDLAKASIQSFESMKEARRLEKSQIKLSDVFHEESIDCKCSNKGNMDVSEQNIHGQECRWNCCNELWSENLCRCRTHIGKMLCYCPNIISTGVHKPKYFPLGTCYWSCCFQISSVKSCLQRTLKSTLKHARESDESIMPLLKMPKLCEGSDSPPIPISMPRTSSEVQLVRSHDVLPSTEVDDFQVETSCDREITGPGLADSVEMPCDREITGLADSVEMDEPTSFGFPNLQLSDAYIEFINSTMGGEFKAVADEIPTPKSTSRAILEHMRAEINGFFIEIWDQHQGPLYCRCALANDYYETFSKAFKQKSLSNALTIANGTEISVAFDEWSRLIPKRAKEHKFDLCIWSCCNVSWDQRTCRGKNTTHKHKGKIVCSCILNTKDIRRFPHAPECVWSCCGCEWGIMTCAQGNCTEDPTRETSQSSNDENLRRNSRDRFDQILGRNDSDEDFGRDRSWSRYNAMRASRRNSRERFEQIFGRNDSDEDIGRDRSWSRYNAMRASRAEVSTWDEMLDTTLPLVYSSRDYWLCVPCSTGQESMVASARKSNKYSVTPLK